MPLKYRFVGQPGDFLMGVPAHDLSAEEFADLPPMTQAFVKAHLKLSNPVYEEVGSSSRRAAAPAGARKSKRAPGRAKTAAEPAKEPEAEKVS